MPAAIIDLQTLILITGLTHLIQMIFFIVLHRTNKVYAGITWWLGWCVLEFVGFSFLLLRQIPEIFAIAVMMQNLSLVGGAVCIYFGIRRFFGKTLHLKSILAAYTVFAFLLAFFLFIDNDIRSRSVILNLAFFVISVPTAITAFRDRPSSIKITSAFIGIITILHGMVFLSRLVIIFWENLSFAPYEISLYNLLGYFDALVVGLLWTYGLVVMVTQWMNADLSESKDRFETIFKMSPDAVILTRITDGFFLEFNDAFTSLMGFTREEVTGKSTLDVNIWKRTSDRDHLISVLKEKGSVSNFEAVFQRKDKSELHGLMSASFFNYNGDICILSVARDISDMKKAGEEIRAREGRHQQYSRLMSELISREGFFRSGLLENLRIISEVTSRILSCPRTSIWVFGNSYSELQCLELYSSVQNSHSSGELLRSSDFPGYINELKKGNVIAVDNVFNDPITLQLPEEYFSSNGIISMLDVPIWKEGMLKGVVCFEYTGSPRAWLRDEREFALTIAYVVSMVFEIAERRKTEEDLLAAKEKAQEADRLKSAFLANMSHEIRTPMNSIVGFAQLLTDPDFQPEEREKYSSIIQSRSDDLMHIINELLEISRIESGNSKIAISNVDLNHLLGEIYLLTRQKLDKLRKQEVNCECILPMESSEAILLTDPYILKQVFTNLIDNAIKFTVTGKISFGYEKVRDGIIHLFVSDTGIGISKKDQDVIFEHFRQADIELAHQYGGAGLGLSICKGLLALLGGDISVDSAPGNGSIFRFTLPFDHPEKNVSGTILPEHGMKRAVSAKWPLKRLLLVEDEHTNVEYLIAILRKTGVSCTCVYNGKQLREKYSMLSQFDLVLLDVRLPDAIGWDLAREMKNLRPDLPVIAQTAFAMSTDQMKSRDSGCDDYISKPIRREDLLQMLDRYLSP